MNYVADSYCGRSHCEHLYPAATREENARRRLRGLRRFPGGVRSIARLSPYAPPFCPPPPHCGTERIITHIARSTDALMSRQVFRYDGSGPVVKREVDVLWDAVWQPAAQGMYPDRPASPGRKGPTAADAAAGKREGGGGPPLGFRR